MNELAKYQGVIVPLVTPLTKDGRLDEAATSKLLSNIISAGAFPFVLGTTGEAMSFSVAERRAFMRLVKELAGDVVTYAGVTCNSFSDTIELADYAQELGYDAIVPHLPGYYPLTDRLMLQYYLQLVEATEAPVILYNIPVTTGMSIPLTVVEELSGHPRIIGLKDSEMGEERLQQNLSLWKDREDFRFFLGCAAYGARGMLRGADGIVPSMGNLIPEHYQAVVDFARAGKAEMAMHHQKICDEVSNCCQAGRTVVDAIPALKYLLELAGYCRAEVASPMQQPDEENKEAIYRALLPLIEKYELTINLKSSQGTAALLGSNNHPW